MTEIVETESGSLYKIELHADGWYIFIPTFKTWKKIVILGKSKAPERVVVKTRIQEFKGAILWFELGDQKKNTSSTTRVQKIYKEIA